MTTATVFRYQILTEIIDPRGAELTLVCVGERYAWIDEVNDFLSPFYIDMDDAFGFLDDWARVAC